MAKRKKETAHGEFHPTNKAKYVGTYPIEYRSSWEYSVMQWCDKHPYVLSWASESIQIPYENPMSRKWTVYIPDFLVVYHEPKSGQTVAEMFEVKPMKEVPGWRPKSGRLSKREQAIQIINAAKWAAARQFCAKRNITFRIVTEEDIYKFDRNA